MKFKTLGLLIVLLFATDIVEARSKKADSEDEIDPDSYDFKDGLVTDFAFLKLSEHYFDPDRFKPKEMLDAGLGELEKRIAEFDYELDEDCEQLIIRVPSREESIFVGGVNSPWEISKTLKRAYRLVSENVKKKERNYYRVETAVVAAMLRKLDPYSRARAPRFNKKEIEDLADHEGGLGVAFSRSRRPPCNGEVTITEVFPGTSAARIGLKPGDQLLRVNDVAIGGLNDRELVKLLSGKLGSLLKLEIRPMDGTKKVIQTVRGRFRESMVEWELLPDKVGYMQLKEFDGNAIAEVVQALMELHALGMTGLVFDLRGNGGGSAYIANSLVNRFVEIGTIESYYNNQDDKKTGTVDAVPEDTEPHYPMVVLVDRGSASASELVAGALRHHGRAFLVGDTTFGKGSAWRSWEVPGGATVSFTVSRYNTPGDISIQEVGLEPDVRLKFAALTRDDVYLERDWNAEREEDRDHYLKRGDSRTRADRASALENTIVLPGEEWGEILGRMERCRLEDGWESYGWRYMKEFARRVVARAQGHTMEMMTAAAGEILANDGPRHESKLIEAMKRLGVDWVSVKGTPVPTKPDDRVAVSAKISGKVQPGQKFKLQVQVKNKSAQTIYRLRGVTKSERELFAGYEFLFGRVAPGRTRSWTTLIAAPEDDWLRTDLVEIEFKAQGGPLPRTADVLISVPARPAPRFAYSWRFEDQGNKNGRLEPGERVVMHAALTNHGPGTTRDAEWRVVGDRGIKFEKSRLRLGRLEPGVTLETAFEFSLDKDFEHEKAKLALWIEDWEKKRYLDHRVEVLDRFIVLPVMQKNHQAGKTKPEKLGLLPTTAPSIDIEDLPRISESKKVTLEGSARHDTQVIDLAVFVGGKKVHYVHNGEVKNKKRIDFKLPLELEEGNNTITVKARHDDYDVGSSRVDVYVPFAKKLTDEEKKAKERRCPN